MKKLYKLKSWFSLADSADRLSAGLGETVTVDDVLQLAIEGHLHLSWYTRHTPALKVVPFTTLYGRGFGSESAYFLLDDNDSSGDVLKAHEGWEALEGEDAIKFLDGPYRLELKFCGALMDWTHAHLTNTGGELISLDGFFVSDPEGTIWQIQEHYPGGRYKIPDGKEKKLKPSYHPSGVFPDKAELIVQRKDIESFENLLAEPSIVDSPNLSARAETSFLNMIGALLDVITTGIPSSEPTSSRIGPAENFKTESRLISAIAHHYEGINGLSKRNLEKKFPAAKRSVNSV